MGDGNWTITSWCYVECIADVKWIMIAFIMVAYCISRWGEQMFIVTLVSENFSRERLGTV